MYKDTLNLPATDFSDAGGRRPPRTRTARPLGGVRPLRAHSRRTRRPSHVHSPRRTTLRQRQHPHGSRPEQDPQGHRRPLPHDARLRRPLRARVGLPRAADRAQGRPRAGQAKGGDVGPRDPRRVPRLRGSLRRDPARRVPAARRPRHLVRAVPHDGAPLRGRHRRRARQGGRGRSALPRAQVDPLVLALPHRPRRGRAGVLPPVATPRSPWRSLPPIPRRCAAPSGSRATPASRSPSGPRRRGRSPRTSRSPSTPRPTTSCSTPRAAASSPPPRWPRRRSPPPGSKAARSPGRRAPSSSAHATATRSPRTCAPRCRPAPTCSASCAPTTSRSTPAPAWSTPRRVTARMTSAPVRSRGSPSSRRSTRPGATPPRWPPWPASTSSRRIPG